MSIKKKKNLTKLKFNLFQRNDLFSLVLGKQKFKSSENRKKKKRRR